MDVQGKLLKTLHADKLPHEEYRQYSAKQLGLHTVVCFLKIIDEDQQSHKKTDCWIS